MKCSSKPHSLSCMRSYYSRLGRINSLEPAMAVLTDEQLKGMTGVGRGKCAARRCGAGKCGATVMGEQLKGMTGVGRGERVTMRCEPCLTLYPFLPASMSHIDPALFPFHATRANGLLLPLLPDLPHILTPPLIPPERPLIQIFSAAASPLALLTLHTSSNFPYPSHRSVPEPPRLWLR